MDVRVVAAPLTGVRDPVIVMGMAQCGTSLLAEMVHRGGIPMYAGDADPSYNTGLKYERPLCKAMNRQILGVARDKTGPNCTEPLWTWELQKFPFEDMESLQFEVGENTPWGFKDPRTTLTYKVWLDAFPRGPRLYTYRGHTEYLRRSLRVQGKLRLRHAQRQIRAWMAYNEAVVRNCAWDSAAGRPWALLYYDALMDDPADRLLRRAEERIGVRLYDARDPSLRRTTPAGSGSTGVPLRDRLYILLAESGHQARLCQIYDSLEALRLR